MPVLSPQSTVAVWLGLLVCAVLLVVCSLVMPADGLGLVSLLLRVVHVAAVMLWAALIWLVNTVVALAPEAGLETDAPRVAAPGTEPAASLSVVALRALVAPLFRATHLAVITGVALLPVTGYVLDTWVFPSAVYIQPLRSWMLWSSVAAGLAMWLGASLAIEPALRRLADPATTSGERIEIARRVRRAARINLFLLLPVTFAMVAAAHLF